MMLPMPLALLSDVAVVIVVRRADNSSGSVTEEEEDGIVVATIVSTSDTCSAVILLWLLWLLLLLWLFWNRRVTEGYFCVCDVKEEEVDCCCNGCGLRSDGGDPRSMVVGTTL
jgi:hypothetical protein